LPRPVRALIRTLARPACVRPEIGAIPVLRLAAQPDMRHMTGRFFNRCRLEPDVADSANAVQFWTACEDMTDQRWPRDHRGSTDCRIQQADARPSHAERAREVAAVLFPESAGGARRASSENHQCQRRRGGGAGRLRGWRHAPHTAASAAQSGHQGNSTNSVTADRIVRTHPADERRSVGRDRHCGERNAKQNTGHDEERASPGDDRPDATDR